MVADIPIDAVLVGSPSKVKTGLACVKVKQHHITDGHIIFAFYENIKVVMVRFVEVVVLFNASQMSFCVYRCKMETLAMVSFLYFMLSHYSVFKIYTKRQWGGFKSHTATLPWVKSHTETLM